MNKSEKTGILKIYVGDSDKVKGRQLSEEIVFAARENGIAGATVFKRNNVVWCESFHPYSENTCPFKRLASTY